jgi:hypothetical protein
MKHDRRGLEHHERSLLEHGDATGRVQREVRRLLVRPHGAVEEHESYGTPSSSRRMRGASG